MLYANSNFKLPNWIINRMKQLKDFMCYSLECYIHIKFKKTNILVITSIWEALKIAVQATDLTQPIIVVDVSGIKFQIRFPDIFRNYRTVHAWFSNPKQLLQNQLNFAVWCATTGCGLSIRGHRELSKSFFFFHVYYQIRRILTEISVTLPQDQAWDAINNQYNHQAYKRICHQFDVSPKDGWHRIGFNHGLGYPYTGESTVKDVRND